MTSRHTRKARDSAVWNFLPPVKRSCVLCIIVLALALTSALMPSFVWAGQEKQDKAGMPGMQTNGEEDMRDMGPSMAAMAGHMYITPLRQRQPGDEEKAKARLKQRLNTIRTIEKHWLTDT